jgi:hypothetical protein
MRSGVSLSNRQIDVGDYGDHHLDVENSLKLFFSDVNPSYPVRFSGLTKSEVVALLGERREEADRAGAMMLLSGLEALFRIDYVNRVDRRKRDPLSQAFRDVFAAHGRRVDLEDTVLGCWKTHADVDSDLISELRGAFKYRHWLAHGRYWTPKLGRHYDYADVYTMAVAIRNGFPFQLT